MSGIAAIQTLTEADERLPSGNHYSEMQLIEPATPGRFSHLPCKRIRRQSPVLKYSRKARAAYKAIVDPHGPAVNDIGEQICIEAVSVETLFHTVKRPTLVACSDTDVAIAAGRDIHVVVKGDHNCKTWLASCILVAADVQIAVAPILRHPHRAGAGRIGDWCAIDCDAQQKGRSQEHDSSDLLHSHCAGGLSI